MDLDLDLSAKKHFESVYIGRQPIYDASLNVFAYELLFRSGEVNEANFIDGDHATTEVILNTFTEIGLTKIIGKHLAFINLTRSFLLGIYPLPECQEQVVLEILEDIEIDEQIIAAVKKLSKQGYTIALDDFFYHKKLEPLIELAQIIKIDLLALTREELVEHVKILRKYDVKLLAEKVETQEEFEFCQKLQFDYYQGYFFCKPKIISGVRPPANKMAAMRVLSKLHDTSINAKEVEELILQDITMSIRLLRYINSSMYHVNRKVESVAHAITLLGLSTVKSVATLVVLSKMEDKPQELIITSLVRAKMSEYLAQRMEPELKDMAFTTGLFSIIDAVMDKPMEEVLAQLPLYEEIIECLIHGKGKLSKILSSVIAYERNDLEALKHCEIASDDLRKAYLSAVSWTDDIIEDTEI
ncbi:Predicted signal transduction protein [hydrothermal vent metagenome]|uniref:Predicted signal transduction protein n=1 Tax=hydrothermal vent metagenome TaxID=652676 RepID=A0A3B1A6X7_9ZZZZ